MQHTIPVAGDSEAWRHLTVKFEEFAARQTGEVRASLLAFLHLVEADDDVRSELLIGPAGDVNLRISANRGPTPNV